MIQPLGEQELDISLAQGFIEEWLKDAPTAAKDNLKILIEGVSFYRQRYLDVQEDFIRLQENYNHLTALSAMYLQDIQQQRKQIDAMLIDSQSEFHRTESE